MSRYDLRCTKCGEIGNGEWHQPMCDESYYQCKCGRWWHPELLESEPDLEFIRQEMKKIIIDMRKINRMHPLNYGRMLEDGFQKLLELLESEPEKKSFDQFERGKKEILSNLYQMQTELIGPGNVWLKQKLEETIDLLLAISVTKSDKKEIDRKSELLTRYRICVRCGKQLSKAEYASVHTCYDEQALKKGDR